MWVTEGKNSGFNARAIYMPANKSNVLCEGQKQSLCEAQHKAWFIKQIFFMSDVEFWGKRHRRNLKSVLDVDSAWAHLPGFGALIQDFTCSPRTFTFSPFGLLSSSFPFPYCFTSRIENASQCVKSMNFIRQCFLIKEKLLKTLILLKLNFWNHLLKSVICLHIENVFAF